MSGEILLQFSLADSANPAATPAEIFSKFKKLVYSGDEDDQNSQIPPADLDDLDRDEDSSDEPDDAAGGPEGGPEGGEKRRRLRLARLRRKSLAARAYQFSGSGTGVQGIVFMEIVRVTDLPPERNCMNHSPARRTLDAN